MVKMFLLGEKFSMIDIYIICVIVSIGICVWYAWADVRRSVVQNVMLIVMLASNLGYLSLALSSDLSTALVSIKVYYVGCCFLPILFFFTACEVSEIKLCKTLISILMAIQSFIYGLVLTIGYSDIYYKNVSFVIDNNVGCIVKDYGVLHILNPIMLFMYFGLSIFICFFTYVRKKTVNRKSLLSMIICFGITVFGYVYERAVGINYELLPIFFNLLMIGALVPIYQSDIFSVMDNQEVIREQLSEVAFITFDKKLHFMGANSRAINLFEELKGADVGERLVSPSPIMTKVIDEARNFIWNPDIADTETHIHDKGNQLVIGEKTFETKIHTLENFIGKRVGITIELRDITEHARIIELTSKYNEELSNEVRKKTERIRAIQQKTILGMAQMVESRDLSTGGHIRRTSDVVDIFAKKLLRSNMGFTRHFLDLVVRSAPMHDLGKIGVDDDVLRKKGRYTEDDYAKMKKHSEIGGRIVKEVLGNVEEEEFVNVAFNVANYHHEKVNGKGYPEGLKGEQIPVEARIMALADVFDALVSKRCYKEEFTYDEAFEIIRKDAGEHFDSNLAEVFLTCRPELEEYYNKAKANIQR